MLLTNRISVPIAVLLCAFIGCGTSAAQAADNNLAAITVATALSGQDLARAGAGEIIPLATLAPALQTRVLDALREAWGTKGYEYYSGGKTLDASRFGVSILPAFSVTFQWSDTNGPQNIDVPLQDHEPVLQGITPLPVGTHASPEPASVPDPPSLAAVMAQEPSAAGEQGAWLRQEAFSLLTPVGKVRLGLAPDVPFTYDAFGAESTYTVATLTAAQQTWLAAVYSQRQQLDARQRAVLNNLTYAPGVTPDTTPGVRHLVAIEGMVFEPARMPVYPLPSWVDLRNASVTLHVEFRTDVTAIDGARPMTGGYAGLAFGIR